MEYRETPPSERFEGLVKTFWQLDARGDEAEWISHRATPDGCIELIIRTAGQSRWQEDQPERFVAGLAEEPVDFEISGDARFVAARIWPWTYHALTGSSPAAFAGRWVDVPAGPLESLFDELAHLPAFGKRLEQLLRTDAVPLARNGRAIIDSATVAEMAHRTEMAPRRLQRWFAQNVGLSPRRYLRLLRFQQAFEALPEASVLADHAAQHGFADQAHMAREFRQMAGASASRAKKRSTGPFLD